MVLLAMAASYSYLAGFLMSLSRSLYCLAEAMDLASKKISRLSKKALMDWPMVSVPSKVGRSIMVTRVFLADQGSLCILSVGSSGYSVFRWNIPAVLAKL